MFTYPKYRQTLHLGVCGFMLAASAGCGASHGDYTPTENQARQALEVMLKTWSEDKPAKSLDSQSPAIHAVDSRWQSGTKLASFEILREEASSETGKKFLVKLDLKNDNAKKDSANPETRYIVVGRGPIWIYEESDYDRVLNMDNNPQSTAATPKARRQPGRGR